MPRLTLVRWMVFTLALVAWGCERRPDFNVDQAHVDIARAFERDTRQINVYSDARGEIATEWIVDFRVEGFEPSMQARFLGTKAAWELADVRETPDVGEREPPWHPVPTFLGRLRGEAHERARTTVSRMSQLADLIGGYALRNGNRFPDVSLADLRQLLLADGSIQEKDWKHEQDGWGQSLLYHASPDGSAYVLISMGADGQLDQDQGTYFSNADQGLEAYGGESSDPNADIIIASGGFVQTYVAR